MSYKNITKSLLLISTLFVSNLLHATVLTGGLNVDNAFQAYVSTDDNVQGSLIGSGANWPSTIGATTSLLSGQNYFLHIAAQDHGGIAGFLGDFSLAGADHLFANGSNFIATNTTDWMVSTTGWSGYSSVTDLGLNGVGPWGFRTGVVSTANWIWSSDAHNDNSVYFTLAINAVNNSNAVPEPSVIALFGLGFLGLGFASRRKLK